MSEVAANLRSQTMVLTDLFNRRVHSLRGRMEYCETLRRLNIHEATRCASIMLGDGEHQAAGVDGSMELDEVLELLLFYVCAGGYCTTFNVNGGGVTFNLEGVTRIPELSVSAAVPLWEEDLPNIVETPQAESDPDLRRSRERIPFALMTMAELNIALQLVRSKIFKIIFLDRPLSGTYPALSRDASMLLRLGRSSLTGLDTKAGKLRFTDIFIAVGLGAGSTWIPPRGGNLTYAVIKALMNKNEMTRNTLGQSLSLGESELKRLWRRLTNLNSRFGDELLEVEGEKVRLRMENLNYWERVIEASLQVTTRIFGGSKHPLIDHKGRWLNVLDLNTINLFLLYALTHEAYENNILLIGIAKDTTATEYTRSVLPFILSSKDSSKPVKPHELSSDRAFLTVLSAVNPEVSQPPWRTVAYDACFTTLMWSPEGEVKLRSARKVISREQMFIRSYFQLRSFKSDQSIRSPVFLYDRAFNPKLDNMIMEVKVEERGGRGILKPFMEHGGTSVIDNLILYILSLSDNSEVMEAYGHNQLLYLADKYVKEEVEQMKGLLKGVVELELTPLARREKVFTVARRFRDLRAESERMRKRHGRLVRMGEAI
ncbi:MAG: hypothetical protein ACUVTM_04895 [Candidatus Bathyarchaeia archaeon]